MKTYQDYITYYFSEPRRYSRKSLANEMNISLEKLDYLVQQFYQKSFDELKLERIHFFAASFLYSEEDLTERLGFPQLKKYKCYLRFGLRVSDGRYNVLNSLLDK